MNLNPIVETKLGELKGRIAKDKNGDEYFSFQGIPYAKPPVGKLRFKAPQPPEPWSCVRDATKEGGESYQRNFTTKQLIGSEDCLYLNVYTKSLENNENSLKPVMVFIHGGSFTGGTGNEESHGPKFFLTKNIVLVTINYRVGFLGFLSLKDISLGVPGNAGLKDQVMALKWIKEHIRVFDGDPNNVTIFGESAGAASVHYLILSPMAKGLFHKAIIQSGCTLSPWSIARRCSDELEIKLNLKNEKELLDYLMDACVEEIFILQEKVQDNLAASNMRPHGPVIEEPNKDAFITEQPIDIILAGNYNAVPLIIGYTNREGMLSAIMGTDSREDVFKVNFDLMVPHSLNLERGTETYAKTAKHIKQFYFGNEEPSIKNIDKNFVMKTDIFFLYGIYNTIKTHLLSSSTPIYFYRFAVEGSLNRYKPLLTIRTPGACHADELGYLFNGINTPDVIPSGSIEDKTIHRMITLWTNFAISGNPNPKKYDPLIDVTWHSVEKDQLHFLDIDSCLKVDVNPEKERMDFWNEIFLSSN